MCSKRASDRGPSPESAKPILLLGHLDTVWPLARSRSMPCRVRDGRLWGPGTLDMKAGVAMASTAIELLMEARSAAPRNHPPAQQRRRDRQPRFAAHHRESCAAVRRRLCARAGAGAGLQNRAQGHRRLAHCRSKASPLMPASISKKAPTPSASWRASSKPSAAGPTSSGASR